MPENMRGVKVLLLWRRDQHDVNVKRLHGCAVIAAYAQEQEVNAEKVELVAEPLPSTFFLPSYCVGRVYTRQYGGHGNAVLLKSPPKGKWVVVEETKKGGVLIYKKG
jgi:hypothetical protein